MTGDEQKDESATDPWADIMADGTAEQPAEASFSFDDAGDPAPAPEPEPAGAEGQPADELVDAWLNDSDPVPADAAQPGADDLPEEVVHDVANDLAADSSSIEIGTGESGIMAEGADQDWDVDATAAEPDEADRADDPDGFAEAAEVSPEPAPVPTAKPKAVKARKPVKSKSVVGQMIGIVLGGVMAFPITFAILIWGLQKDPFKVTKYVPANLTFLLPQKFQPGFKKAGPALSQAQTLDDVARIPTPAAEEAARGSDAMPADETAGQHGDDADAGRPLAGPPQQLDGLHGRLRPHQEELVRLGRNWLDFAKRPSDGIVLPVTFESSRRVGPYWSSRVTLALPKGGSRELAVISRAEPAAVAGDGVVVTGMLFDGDVIWAADVRPLAPDFAPF